MFICARVSSNLCLSIQINLKTRIKITLSYDHNIQSLLSNCHFNPATISMLISTSSLHSIWMLQSKRTFSNFIQRPFSPHIAVCWSPSSLADYNSAYLLIWISCPILHATVSPPPPSSCCLYIGTMLAFYA